MTLRSLLPAFALPFVLVACDAGTPAYGGLDENGDGVLSAADVEAGQLAVHLEIRDADDVISDEKAEHMEASLAPVGSGRWELSGAFADGKRLSLNFEAMELEAGESPLSSASLQATDEESAFYAFNMEPEGAIVLDSVTEEGVSGAFEGTVELEVLGAMEQPTGETVVVHAFAFKSVPVAQPE